MRGFYSKCFTSNFENFCYFCFLDLLFGLFLLIFNIFAFAQMTKYYGKMNFENTMILLSSIQFNNDTNSNDYNS